MNTTQSTEQRERGPVDVCSHFTQGQTPFMKFWKVTNDILKSHGLPQMLYGEARDEQSSL